MRLQATSRDAQIATLHDAAIRKPVLAPAFTALAEVLDSTVEEPLNPLESLRWSKTQRALVGLAELVLAGAL